MLDWPCEPNNPSRSGVNHGYKQYQRGNSESERAGPLGSWRSTSSRCDRRLQPAVASPSRQPALSPGGRGVVTRGTVRKLALCNSTPFRRSRPVHAHQDQHDDCDPARPTAQRPSTRRVAALSYDLQGRRPLGGGTGDLSPSSGPTALSIEEVVMTTVTPNVQWHALRQLTGLPGPQWRLPPQQGDDLRLVRAFEHYVETVCVDGDVVAVSRQPITGRFPNTIASQNFAGSISEVVDFLRQRPSTRHDYDTHLVGSPSIGDEATIAWPGDELASTTSMDMDLSNDVHASAQPRGHRV
jgi:hypothetical protein